MSTQTLFAALPAILLATQVIHQSNINGNSKGLELSTGEEVEIRGVLQPGYEQVLTPEALSFVARLHREFNLVRRQLLRRRAERQAELDAGVMPDFLTATRHIREADWQVAPVPADLQKRWVEITGPTDRKMVINALNSGANVYMADFEDANTPTWSNMVEGQINLINAAEGTISYTSPEGKTYRLGDQLATLVVRPRGWHLPERHVRIHGEPVAGAFFDFGMYAFHNAHRLLAKGTGPYFYLPKLESHIEARLWNDILVFAQDELRIPRGTMKATVLIEVILAAFEMDEILYELRDHAGGLNAGRWDYIFSIIKKFSKHRAFALPERAQITMTVPFMRAYTELLGKTCHRRGAHALGGMAAFIPNRKNLEINQIALAKVRDDKIREATDGFDGTWVAHPDLVPVAMEVFMETLRDRPHQIARRRDEVTVTARDLLDVRVPGGAITEAGLRSNISAAIQYMESWLRGVGAAAIYNLMEDAATAEIARAQVWQWARHHVQLAEGPQISRDLVRNIAEEELSTLREHLGPEIFDQSRFADARELFEEVALGEQFVEFFTLAGYDRVD